MSDWIDLDKVKYWEENCNEGDVGAISAMIQEYGFRQRLGS